MSETFASPVTLEETLRRILAESSGSDVPGMIPASQSPGALIEYGPNETPWLRPKPSLERSVVVDEMAKVGKPIEPTRESERAFTPPVGMTSLNSPMVQASLGPMPGTSPSPQGSWQGDPAAARILVGPNGVPLLTNQAYPGAKEWSGTPTGPGLRGQAWVQDQMARRPPAEPVDVSMAALEGRLRSAQMLGAVRGAEEKLADQTTGLREEDQIRAINEAKRAAALQEAQLGLRSPEEISLAQQLDVEGLRSRLRQAEVTPEQRHAWEVAQAQAKDSEYIARANAVKLLGQIGDPDSDIAKVMQEAKSIELKIAADPNYLAKKMKENPEEAANVLRAMELAENLKRVVIPNLVALVKGRAPTNEDVLGGAVAAPALPAR